MELKEILEKYRNRVTLMNEFFSDKPTQQAHSDILKWIESKLPPQMHFTPIGKTIDGFVMGQNNYRQQTLKNLGITKPRKEQ